jgi:hypothetical protein
MQRRSQTKNQHKGFKAEYQRRASGWVDSAQLIGYYYAKQMRAGRETKA